MLNKLKIPMTFTFEISNGLYENDKKVDILLNKNMLLESGSVILKGLFRYVQLEMRIPKKLIKAKVDSRNPRKYLNSGQSVRHHSELFKKKISKELPEVLLERNKLKNKSHSEDDEKGEKNKEFMALIKEIKNE